MPSRQVIFLSHDDPTGLRLSAACAVTQLATGGCVDLFAFGPAVRALMEGCADGDHPAAALFQARAESGAGSEPLVRLLACSASIVEEKVYLADAQRTFDAVIGWRPSWSGAGVRPIAFSSDGRVPGLRYGRLLHVPSGGGRRPPLSRAWGEPTTGGPGNILPLRAWVEIEETLSLSAAGSSHCFGKQGSLGTDSADTSGSAVGVGFKTCSLNGIFATGLTATTTLVVGLKSGQINGGSGRFVIECLKV